MKTVLPVLLAVGVQGNEVNPIEKVVQMMSDLEAKIIGEGKEAQKTYDEFAEWCEDRSKDLQFEIKTGKANKADLEASIQKETATSEELTAKIEDLSADVAADEAELKEATAIREKEAAAFAAEEKELQEVIDMLQRAVAILEKEMGGGASMMQIKTASNLEQALAAMVQASAISSADATKLSSFVQTQESDEETGAPAGEVYESKSAGIVDTLNGLLDKAQGQLDAATKEETTAKNNYDLKKQSLTDEMKYANKDMDAAKKGLAESSEIKAAAEGDLGVTTKDLNEDVNALGSLHQDCMTKAEDFEAETNSRGEELKALAMAKKAVKDNTGGATEQQYSFLQVSSDSTNFEVIRMVKDLARKQQAPELAQLASRLSSAVRLNHGADVFAKIKGMISDMVEKLEQEAAEAAELKEWCDKEIAESTDKKEEADALFEKLSTKLNSAESKSAKLKEEVAQLQKELAELADTQVEMDKIRADEKATYEKNKPEMEQGLKGVKLALKILNDYYAKADKAHSSSDGAGSGIIGMLEVIESDFTKSITEMVAAEQTAASSFETQSNENAIEKTTKEQDVKYKTKEAASLDKKAAELTTDRDGVKSELDAVNEYLKSLDDKCTYKVESYAERKARREAEINGLKEALDILENETAFVQTGSLRGVKKHA
jgi:chromosome segregation ATPase